MEEMQQSLKLSFKSTAFLPNWANMIISKRDRQLKSVLLVDALKENAKEGLELYDFMQVLACMERQMKGVKVGRLGNINRLLIEENSYIRRSLNDKVFADLEKQKMKQEEAKEKKEAKEEAKEETKEEAKEEAKEEVKEEAKEEEVTVESLLVFVGWVFDV